MESRVRSVDPILPVADIKATLEWYRQNMGAENAWEWGEPPTVAGCRIGAIGFLFTLDPERVEKTMGLNLYIGVANIRGFLELLRDRGTPIHEELQPKPWGMDEFSVVDLNGIVLRFGEATRRPAGQPPGDYTVIEQDLSPVEYHALFQAVGWTTDPNPPEEVETPLVTMAAISDQAIIGAASIFGGNGHPYVVRNVVVVPKYHQSGVGTRLMHALHDWAETNLPKGTTLQLFTGTMTVGFYERLGYIEFNPHLIGMERKV